MKTVLVEKPGLWTSIQRISSPSLVAYGFPVGGPMDRTSAIKANHLVGNNAEEYLLEITLLGPKLLFTHSCVIALTGADLQARLDGRPIDRYRSYQVEVGQRLSFGSAQNGCRAYLAIAGQWNPSQVVLGLSQPLAAQTELDIACAFPSIQNTDSVPHFESSLQIPLLPGPEFDRFSRGFIAYFFSQTWSITPQSNRMGYRLKGSLRSIPKPGIAEIISSGIVPGTIQITGNGQPILLLVDAQTTGGYPRFGNVQSQDLDAIGQLKPGDWIQFTWKT